MGLLDDIWDRPTLEGFDLALCSAGLDPDATPEELELNAEWLTWGTYGDDYYPIAFGRTRNLLGAKECTERLKSLMPVGDPAAGKASAVAPIERSLADLWARTAAPMATEAREQLRTALHAMLDSWMWELFNQIQHRVPDPVDYVEMRRTTFGSELTMLLCRLRHSEVLPPGIHRTGTIRALENSAADYAALLNDLFSYQKEVEVQGEVHNGVLVLQTFFDCDYPAAVSMVDDLMRGRLRQFEHVKQHELPMLYEDFALDAAGRAALESYVRELEDWLAGILNWHRSVRRYGADDAHSGGAALVRLGPTGIGTSAARVGALFTP
jgi:germacradienol/geosmin synthase